MNLKKQIVWFIASASLFLGVASVTAHARDYSVDRYRVNVNVLKNGDAVVTQRVTYAFDGSFNGIYYTQDTAGIGSLTKSSVAVENGSRTQALRRNNSEQPRTYKLSKSGNDYRFKVFYPISDDTATFVYRYRLGGVVTNFKDTAELNWKIIGTGWDVDLDHVTIKVALPVKNISKLQAWTHGPLDGRTKVDKQAGTVTMAVDHVDSGDFVESHLLFPTSVTSLNRKTRATDRLKAAQALEVRLAKEANAKRERAKLIPVIIGAIALAIGALYLLIQWLWFWRHPANKVVATPPVHNFEIPPFPAVTAQSILSRTEPDESAFSAWLMELAGAQEITITPEEVGRTKTYRLTQTAKLTATHRDDPLLKYVFETIGTENEAGLYTVTLEDISDFGDGQSEELSDMFDDWQEAQFDDVEALHFFDKTNGSIQLAAWLLIIFNLILAFGGGLCAAFSVAPWRTIGLVASGLLVVLTLVVAVPRLWHLSPYTQAGEDAAGPIRGFKQMLADIGHFERSQVGDIILWEQILPYAVAFGSAKKVIAALNTNFSVEELEAGLGLYYPLFFYGDFGSANFASQFDQSFGANISSASSVSGGSGGFSGGSSGGFGGGSGGGAF